MGATTTPIEGRWSLSVDPSKPLILLGLWRVDPFFCVDPSKPLILLGLWRRIEKGQTDGNPLDPSNYKHRGLVTTCFQVYYTFPARNIQALDADPSEGGYFMPYADPVQRKNESRQEGKARARAEKKAAEGRERSRCKGARGRSSFIPNRLRRTGRTCLMGFTFNGRAVRSTIAT